MGLDMFLYCNDYELVKEVQEAVRQRRRGTVMYWRKANAIHRWFIEEAEYSSHEDDCTSIEITVNDLKRLRSLCQEVLENPEMAPELLPTQEGFFFGSQEYDDWYFENLERTEKTFGKILSLLRSYTGTSLDRDTWSDDFYHSHPDWIVRFEYRASW